VRSSEGAGATFTVRLPLRVAPEEAAPTSALEALGDAADTQGHQP
jgi:hypothetical protein